MSLVYVTGTVTVYVSNLNILLKCDFPTFFDISITKKCKL